MTEPLGALEQAVQHLTASDKPGGNTHTLGPATTGHWCPHCELHTAEAADVLAITPDGVQTIATFIHCPSCERRRTEPST